MPTTLFEFWNMLDKHDWTHAYSDDHRVYRAGSDMAAKLRRIAEESPKHKKLMEDFADHIWGENKPKPRKPRNRVAHKRKIALTE